MRGLRATHTYALLEVSPQVFAEVKAKLEAAGYQHAFNTDDGKPVIDMHGIALVSEPVMECIHGEAIDGLCNACSDFLGAGFRATKAGVIDVRSMIEELQR